MLFSIGVPAYKKKFLKECIDSILLQTYTNFELIIINDASPENIEEIANKFSDIRIRYYKNELNTGAENVIDNWNNCLSYANGDFFVLMGDDDVMEPNYLEEFLKLINQYPLLDVFHCRSYIINEYSDKIETTPSWPEYESIYENIWHRIKSLRQQFISDFIYRTKTLKSNGGFFKLPLAWGSDDISSYIACAEKGIAHINTPLFNYRRSLLTISSTGNSRLKMAAILLEEEWLSNFLTKKPDNYLDKILHSSIQSYYKKYMQKKKIRTMSLSFDESITNYLVFWIVNRHKFNLRLNEILYSMVEYLKSKTSKNQYNDSKK